MIVGAIGPQRMDNPGPAAVKDHFPCIKILRMGRLACIWPAMGLGVYQKNALGLKTWLLATRWWEYTAGNAEWK